MPTEKSRWISEANRRLNEPREVSEGLEAEVLILNNPEVFELWMLFNFRVLKLDSDCLMKSKNFPAFANGLTKSLGWIDLERISRLKLSTWKFKLKTNFSIHTSKN